MKISCHTVMIAAVMMLAARAPAESELRAAGMNKQGQLGIGTTGDALTPQAIDGLTDVIKIAAGPHHTLAIQADGTLWSWGSNRLRQLGVGPLPAESHVPLHVSTLSNVTDAAAGPISSMAVTVDGTVYAWGGDYSSSGIPAVSTTLSDITAIDWGTSHRLSLRTDGQVSVSGDNSVGQLGLGTTNSFAGTLVVPKVNNAIAIAAGAFHSLVLLKDGSVLGWGLNNRGQLGDGTNINGLSPVAVSGLSNIVQIAAGNSHNLALRSDGVIFAWGKNSSGQVGDGTTNDALAPVPLSAPVAFEQISAGGDHSLAIDINGNLWAWGSNLYGQLGDGTQTDRSEPTRMLGLSNCLFAGSGTFQTFATIQVVASCPADIAPPGGNGAVNVDDLLLVINSWGPCPGSCAADIAPASGGNGVVNVDDLLLTINGWGPCD